MPDPITLAAVLLVVGPVIGAVPIANPSLLSIWSASREAHLATVGAHRRAWALLNAGFAVATILTSGGLAILALASDADPGRGAALAATAAAYAIGGVLWCAVLAVRTRTTPALADLVAAGEATDPAETLLGAAMGGVFVAFALTTGGALVALGVALLAGGGVAAPVAGVAVVVGALAVVVQLVTGDLIPAVLYLPTLLIGVALLASWT